MQLWDVTYQAGAALAEDRQTSRQLDLVASLKQRARERHQAFINGPAHQMAEKILELEKEVLKDQRQMAKMEARQLEQQMVLLPCASTWIVVLGEEEREKTALKKQVMRAFRGSDYQVAVHGQASFLTAVRNGSFFQTMPTSLIYLCADAGTLRGLTDPELVLETAGPEDDQRQMKATDLSLCTRLLGGYIATRAWAEKIAGSAANGGDVIEPWAA